MPEFQWFYTVCWRFEVNMKDLKKNRKAGYSCVEGRLRGEYNPIKHIHRWGRNIKHAYQRIRYGYCDRDVWSIDWWFLNVVPNMLEDLKETSHGYPSPLEDKESKLIAGTCDSEEKDEKGMQQWKDILSEMIFLFREANEDTCTRKNPYDEEYNRASEGFTNKYGCFGERLKTEEEKAEEKKSGMHKLYMLSDVPEYKDISEKYLDEEKKIRVYRDECKDAGLDMFKKWFWALWD